MVCNNADEAKLAERMRFHGIIRLPDGTRDVAEAAAKFNMPDVSARVGVAQLARLDQFNERRRELVAHYFANFASTPACLLPHPGYSGDETGHSWNMFAPLLPLTKMRLSRQQFMQAMHQKGIGCGISYEALHLSTLSKQQWATHEGQHPNAERISRETVTLPLATSMSLGDVERVCTAVREVLAEQ